MDLNIYFDFIFYPTKKILLRYVIAYSTGSLVCFFVCWFAYLLSVKSHLFYYLPVLKFNKHRCRLLPFFYLKSFHINDIRLLLQLSR